MKLISNILKWTRFPIYISRKNEVLLAHNTQFQLSQINEVLDLKRGLKLFLYFLDHRSKILILNLETAKDKEKMK